MTIYFEEMHVGLTAEFGKTLSEADIVMFAAATGDNNPVHTNQEYAEGTMFKTRIAHGMLTASLISTVLGTKLPGPGTIYLSQSSKFRRPVKLGETVTARITITALEPEKMRVTFETNCYVKGVLVLEGEATVIAPGRPAA